jgi:hypothetical protein
MGPLKPASPARMLRQAGEQYRFKVNLESLFLPSPHEAEIYRQIDHAVDNPASERFGCGSHEQ